MRVATYNVENLFSRVSAMAADDPAKSKEVLEDVMDLQRLIEQPTYSAADKTKMLMIFDNRMFHNHEVSPRLSAEDRGSLFGAVKNYFKSDFNLLPSVPVPRCDLMKKASLKFYRLLSLSGAAK